MCKDGYQSMVAVFMEGNAFTFDRYPLPPLNKPKRKGQQSYYNDDSPLEPTPEAQESLVKQYRRAKSRFIAELCRLKGGEPSYFLTVMTPRRQRPFVNYDEERKVLDRFIRWLTYRFPHCWFIYKVEWSNVAAIHFHLIGDFMGPHDLPRMSLPQIKKEVKRLWEAATGASADNSVDLLYYDERHKSYLTARNKRKFKGDIRCSAILHGRRMWGHIHKKYISFHERVVFKLTPEQFERFSNHIIKYFSDTCPTAFGHIIQLSRTRGRVSFVPREVILAAYHHAKSRG